MPKKYTDFAESAPRVRLSKQNARDERDTRSYVTITCPHCSVDFVEIAADSLSTNKASECKKHLLRCDAASAAGIRPEPVKRKRTDVSPDAALRVELEAEKAKEDLMSRATHAALSFAHTYAHSPGSMFSEEQLTESIEAHMRGALRCKFLQLLVLRLGGDGAAEHGDAPRAVPRP